MDLFSRLGIGLWNGWLLALPMLLAMGWVPVCKPEVARRMADMTGYTPREKLATVAASLLPYAFLALSVLTPIWPRGLAFSLGLMIYLVGLAGFGAAVLAYARARPDELATSGIYRWSRNPMYLFASLTFLGIALMCASFLLLLVLTIMLGFQHFMILAEERACAARYGEPYQGYLQRTARYFLLF